jgi:hypothetical protein
MMTSAVFRDRATPAMWAKVFAAAKVHPFEAQRDLYREYVDSAAWDGRRHEEIAKAGGECSECRNRATPGIPLQVHHLSYERLGAELPTDLVVLCRLCHECKHGRSQIARVVEAVFGREDPERERRREENKRRCGHYRDRGRGGVA